MPKTAIVSGSFDPITVGHEDLIRRAAGIFGSVIVAFSENSVKPGIFPDDILFEAVKSTFSDDENIQVIKLEGLLAEFVKEKNGFIVRGIRSNDDYGYESNLSKINREISDVETVFIQSSPQYDFISSTFVREMIKYHRSIEKYVPSRAFKVFENEINNY